jgi:hypothetical protein
LVRPDNGDAAGAGVIPENSSGKMTGWTPDSVRQGKSCEEAVCAQNKVDVTTAENAPGFGLIVVQRGELCRLGLL